MQRFVVDEQLSDLELTTALHEPAMALRNGELVAFPTETVYGLGANAFDEAAVRRIFAAKRRPVDNPLIVHIATMDQLRDCVPAGYVINEVERALMEAFWPGPLTILVPVGPLLAPSVHPSQASVGVRMPAHRIARALIEVAGVPVAAPSANTSGKPSPTQANAVAEDLGDALWGLVDGGLSDVGVESTVVSVEQNQLLILRPGGVTREMLAATVDVPVVLDAYLTHGSDAPRAPGMKYRHYAPEANVHVWWGDADRVGEAMSHFLQTQQESERERAFAPAVVAPRALKSHLPSLHQAALQAFLPDSDYERTLAQSLYALLRTFDHNGATDILIAGVNPAHGIGTAVMNRLDKASEGRIYAV